MTTFQKAKRDAIPLLIALEGASGSGKTKSGLELLAGIGDAVKELKGREPKLLVVDTENRRALMFADEYDFSHYDMQAPFSPGRFGEILHDAEKEGFDAIMFDSFSHEWSGQGGVKEWADRIAAGVPKPGIANPRGPGDAWDWWKDWDSKPVQGPGAWAEPKSSVKPGHKWLVNEILRSPMHVIVCLRSESKLKMESVQVVKNGQPQFYESGKNAGKPIKETVVTGPADLPLLERWVPDCEKNLPYELTTSILVVPDEPGIPHFRKEVTASGAPRASKDRQISRPFGRALALWAAGKAWKQERNTPDGSGKSREDPSASESTEAQRSDSSPVAQHQPEPQRREEPPPPTDGYEGI